MQSLRSVLFGIFAIGINAGLTPPNRINTSNVIAIDPDFHCEPGYTRINDTCQDINECEEFEILPCSKAINFKFN